MSEGERIGPKASVGDFRAERCRPAPPTWPPTVGAAARPGMAARPVAAAVLLAAAAPRALGMGREERIELREAARGLFTHGYDAYMENAYPLGELKPLTCTGQNFDLSKV